MFNTQAEPGFTIGQEYRFTLRQMALSGKSPWVRAEFAYLPSGRTKHERTEVTGHFMTMTFPTFDGLFVFQVSGTDGSKVTATLLMIL